MKNKNKEVVVIESQTFRRIARLSNLMNAINTIVEELRALGLDEAAAKVREGQTLLASAVLRIGLDTLMERLK